MSNTRDHFDYHLQPSEQEQVERIVPANQAKIHLAFRANVSFIDKNSARDSKKEYKGAAVALSEHNITFCCHGFFGKSYKLLAVIHVNDITGLSSESDTTTVLKVINGTYIIISPAVIRFTRNLIRNYILSNPMLPPSLRFTFNAVNPKNYPMFNPQLSPSQQFQFTYNANCSYFDETYYHDIPRYFHNLIKTGSAIFDFTQLPIHLMETGLGLSSDIRPITSSLMFCPFIYGINISDITRDDIIQSCAPIVMMNPNMRIIRLLSTGAQNGCIPLSKAMLQARHPGVVYWDLSDNQLEDISYFVDALGDYHSQLITLRLNNCKMTNAEITTLFNSLSGNDYNHHIQQLALIGNTLNKANCGQFGDLLRAISGDNVFDDHSGNFKDLPEIESANGHSDQMTSPDDDSLSEENKFNLNHLEFGPVKYPKGIFDALMSHSIPIETLKFVDSSFDEESANSLISYLRGTTTLKYLDISNCSFKDIQLEAIITSFISNTAVNEVSLILNKLKIHGKRYAMVMQALTQYSDKIVELSLNENGLSQTEPLFIDLGQFKNLKRLSLALNFNKKMQGIGNSLIQLLGYSNLKSLNIAGGGSSNFLLGNSLLDESYNFINALYTNNALEELDISGNLIGDQGIKMISNVLRENTTLQVIKLDNSNPTSLAPIIDFLDAVTESKTIIDADFPENDIYNLLSLSPAQSKHSDIEQIAQKRLLAQLAVTENRSTAGVYSNLTLLNDDTLNSIIDEVTLELQEIYDNLKVPRNEHSALTEVVGLPLPYEEESDFQNSPQPISPTTKQSQEQNYDKDDPYASKDLMSAVVEPTPVANADSFKTLQFNSLCIRRPDAMQKLEEKGKFMLMDVKISNLRPPKHSDEETDSAFDAEPVTNVLLPVAMGDPTEMPVIDDSHIHDALYDSPEPPQSPENDNLL